ncbi:hypothetical protein ACFYUL_17900 [Streptomyces sp. NPDC004311]|uniref:hypothetical protein n=1 Tax=Streptomyces sp. NPDC004311 TaxID=3364698 RepID=UPI00368F1E55
MTVITAEISAPKTKPPAPRSRPLTRQQMHHQRIVEWRRPEGRPTVGMLAYRSAYDDEHAKWLVVPMEYGVTLVRVPWESVEAGEFFGTGVGALSVEEHRTLGRWIRQQYAEE